MHSASGPTSTTVLGVSDLVARLFLRAYKGFYKALGFWVQVGFQVVLLWNVGFSGFCRFRILFGVRVLNVLIEISGGRHLAAPS